MRRTFLVLACVTAALTAFAPAAEAGLRFRSCNGVGCARLSVPLDRSGSQPGRLSLYVERRRAAGAPHRGVALLLAGGPGQPGTTAFGGPPSPASYRDFARLLPGYDIVAFDQRGTGSSGLLRCPSLEGASLIDAGAEAADCARRLGSRRGLYRTVDSVEDIETLRAALGARRLTLIGVSYGTFVAQAYAARYPTRVGRLVLDSVLDPAGWDPFYRDMFTAIPRVLRSVCRSRCRRFTPDPVTDTERLVARLAEAPLRGRVALPDGRVRPARLTREELFFTLVAGDLDDVSRAAYPAAVVSALRGDPAPILRLRRRAIVSESSGTPREFSSGLYAATVCEETRFPWTRFSAPQARLGSIADAVSLIPPAALRPFDAFTAAANDFIRMCRRWPEAAPAPEPLPGPLPDVPVLMLEGEFDVRTSIESAGRADALWPRAQVLVAPNTGHSTLSADVTGCTVRAMRGFLLGRQVRPSCPRTPTLFPPGGPLPASLGEAPRRGPAGARGRVIGAVELTLLDVAEDFLAAFGPARGAGLRGGRWNWTGVPLVLDRVELVPGVRLTGRIRRFGQASQRGTLRISGPGGPNGRIRLAGNRVTGRLGGRRVRGTIRIGILSGASAAAQPARSPAKNVAIMVG